MVTTKIYTEPPICEKEILRYAGCKDSDEEFLQFLRACVEEVRGKLSYKVCFQELPVNIAENTCDFGCMKVQSHNLAQNLKGTQSVILFAATIGVEIDRLITKYGKVSPSKALMFQAIGAERIEALCDAFCEDIKSEKQMATRPRFSPGYGDVPLETQKDMFRILECSKKIGLSLNDSLLMSPSKSVTAFVGLAETTEKTNKCAACDKTDCEYRGA